MKADSAQMRRLQWHCRRGMLELDVLFERFLAEQYSHLSVAQQQVFSRLLECADQELWNWLMANEQSQDPELNAMVTRIRQGRGDG